MKERDVVELLADARQGGVYFVDMRDRTALIEAANTLGFAVLPVDCIGCRGKAAVIAAFAQALRFPDWFGDNWDALADSLGDLSWLPASGYLLLLEHFDPWRAGEPEEFDLLLDVLNDTATRWIGEGRPFWVLLPVPAAQLAAIAD